MADDNKRSTGAILADAVNYNALVDALEEGVELTDAQKARLRKVAGRLGKQVPDGI